MSGFRHHRAVFSNFLPARFLPLNRPAALQQGPSRGGDYPDGRAGNTSSETNLHFFLVIVRGTCLICLTDRVHLSTAFTSHDLIIQNSTAQDAGSVLWPVASGDGISSVRPP